ncbi:hypothetical protein Pmani_013045 [Petrolisthes manimaculis]|uniref:Uncharacterized protein n=1 Tax=Petrolisthes manimaculis TaxID=1843537 RepID=A0AAE1UEH4_9EUCA|nr:hypothetical protein Pmani_013045 [Petrolisthes manimaculis]
MTTHWRSNVALAYSRSPASTFRDRLRGITRLPIRSSRPCPLHFDNCTTLTPHCAGFTVIHHWSTTTAGASRGGGGGGTNLIPG